MSGDRVPGGGGSRGAIAKSARARKRPPGSGGRRPGARDRGAERAPGHSAFASAGTTGASVAVISREGRSRATRKTAGRTRVEVNPRGVPGETPSPRRAPVGERVRISADDDPAQAAGGGLPRISRARFFRPARWLVSSSGAPIRARSQTLDAPEAPGFGLRRDRPRASRSSRGGRPRDRVRRLAAPRGAARGASVHAHSVRMQAASPAGRFQVSARGTRAAPGTPRRTIAGSPGSRSTWIRTRTARRTRAAATPPRTRTSRAGSRGSAPQGQRVLLRGGRGVHPGRLQPQRSRAWCPTTTTPST